MPIIQLYYSFNELQYLNKFESHTAKCFPQLRGLQPSVIQISKLYSQSSLHQVLCVPRRTSRTVPNGDLGTAPRYAAGRLTCCAPPNRWSTHEINTRCRHSCSPTLLGDILSCFVVVATRPNAPMRRKQGGRKWNLHKSISRNRKVRTSKTKFKTHEVWQRNIMRHTNTLQSTVPRIFPGRMHRLRNCQSLRRLKTFSLCIPQSTQMRSIPQHMSPTFRLSTRLSMFAIGLPMKHWRKLPHASQNQSKHSKIRNNSSIATDWQAVLVKALHPFDQFDPGRFLQSLGSIEKEWLLWLWKVKPWVKSHLKHSTYLTHSTKFRTELTQVPASYRPLSSVWGLRVRHKTLRKQTRLLMLMFSVYWLRFMICT